MDAIGNVLEIIRQLADERLQNLDRRGDQWVVLTNIVDHDGRLNEAARNKIVMQLYSITHETIIATYNAAQPRQQGDYTLVAPPLYIDLHLAFTANFVGGDYPAGLAAISRIISIFQQNPWLTHATTPQLDPAIDKITLEFTSLHPADTSRVMGMLGTRYMPSVFYKLRMIPYGMPAMQARADPVSGTSTPDAPK